MELVHHDHVEVRRVEVRDTCGVQALDRGEDVLEPRGSFTAHPALAKRVLAEAMAKSGEGLVEDPVEVGRLSFRGRQLSVGLAVRDPQDQRLNR
jgi:hypothetical protein